MKDVLSLVVFAGKVLCLMVFVAVLKPDSIGAVQQHRVGAAAGPVNVQAAIGSRADGRSGIASGLRICEYDGEWIWIQNW